MDLIVLIECVQEIYYLLAATVIGKTRPYKDSPTV